jgi:hypothetical protein
MSKHNIYHAAAIPCFLMAVAGLIAGPSTWFNYTLVIAAWTTSNVMYRLGDRLQVRRQKERLDKLNGD